MKNISGYIGSGLVHLTVAGLLVAGALFARNLTPETPAISPGITLVADSGNEARSSSAPAVSGTRTPAGLPTVASISAKPIIDEIRRRDREEAALAASTATTVSGPVAKPVVTSKPVVISKKPVAPGVGATAPVKPPGIAGVRLAPLGDAGSLSSSGSNALPGSGASGGPPSADSGESAFAAEVTGKFAAAYRPLFELRGGALSSDADSGKFRVTVSPSGSLVFRDWITAPAEHEMDAIVREAVKKMARVSPPPAGAAAIVVITVSGTVTE